MLEIKELIGRLIDVAEYQESINELAKFLKVHKEYYPGIIDDLDDLILELPEHIKIKERMWTILYTV